jgi:rubrerythrin
VVSRRGFLGAAAGGAAVVLGGCGSRDPNAGDETASNLELLNGMLDLEHLSVAAYTTSAIALHGSRARMGRRFRDQELEHVKRLSDAVRELGGTPNMRRKAYDFPELRTDRQVMRFAVDLESTAVAAYLDALPRLTDPSLRAAVASIVCVEAEQIAALRDELGLEPVPDAFVTGKS